jgi:intraflagellar transport protein 172
VGQSDKIVYVYKLGDQWGERKTICNKFPVPAAVTALKWPTSRPNELVAALSDGSMRLALMRSNKLANLTMYEQCAVSLAASPGGEAVYCGHVDGTVERYAFPDPEAQVPATQSVVANVGFAPYALAITEQHVVVAGPSPRVLVYSLQGALQQQLDFSDARPALREFTCGALSTSGQSLVLGNFDCFVALSYDVARRRWKEAGVVSVPNLYSVTALAWEPSGARLATGSLMGAVDVFEACLKRYHVRGRFEVVHTAPSAVLVRTDPPATEGKEQPPFALASRAGRELGRVSVFKGRFAVARTAETLLVGDMLTRRASEVEWTSSAAANGGKKAGAAGGAGSGLGAQRRERFFFHFVNACVVAAGGELVAIELGNNEPIARVRTEFVSPSLVSLRVAPATRAALGGGGEEKKGPAAAGAQPVRCLAYLLDQNTIRVVDLVRGEEAATVAHDARVDWLQLNPRGTKLLFRDSRRALHLFDMAAGQRSTMLPRVSFASWVPDSDVAVAQHGGSLCVWYSVDAPDQMTQIAVKGVAETVERGDKGCFVMVDDGQQRVAVPLNEALIAFGSAVDRGNLEQAMGVLEAARGGAGTQGMWQRLAELALASGALRIAERSYAALGDMAKASFLARVAAMADELPGGVGNVQVRARLALLAKQAKRAEAMLLEQGRVEEAVQMYAGLQKWDAAIALAQTRAPALLPALRQSSFDYLLATHQDEVAGALKEAEGDFNAALQLYLRARFPEKAAALVLRQQLTQNAQLLEAIAAALVEKGLLEQAGDFLAALGGVERALEAFKRAGAYKKALDIARRHYPASVVALEEEWGDALVAQRNPDAACNHYIEAGAWLKAVNAAIDAKQWSKLKILEHLDAATARPFLIKVAEHHCEVRELAQAERLFVQAGEAARAVAMYIDAEQLEDAMRVGKASLSVQELNKLVLASAKKLEASNKLAAAEALYLAVQEPDLAIAMYKRHRLYDDMVRLVAAHRKKLLPETHKHLAAQLALEGKIKQAETHYLKAGEWRAAANLYRERDEWEDALRVAKLGGGTEAVGQVALAYAGAITSEAGWANFNRLGLGEAAVKSALDKQEFQAAFRVAEQSCRHKIPEVHLQLAMSLEDTGRFDEAEAEFVRASKPKEAIEMWCHQRDWARALRVAEAHLPEAAADVYTAQAAVAIESRDFAQAETMLRTAGKPEAIVQMYIDAGLFNEAARAAQMHAPHLASQVRLVERAAAERTLQQTQAQAQQQPLLARAPSSAVQSGVAGSLAARASALEQQGQWPEAVDTLMQAASDPSLPADAAQQFLTRAVRMALERGIPKAGAIAEDAARRLERAGLPEAGADLCLLAERPKSALDLLLRARLYDKARLFAQMHAPELLDFVSRSVQAALAQGAVQSGGDATGGGGGGVSEETIEAHANRGNWDKVYELATQQGPETVQHFASLHALSLVQAGKFVEALRALSAHGAAVVPSNFALFKRIGAELLARVQPLTSPAEEKKNLGTEVELASTLRDFLLHVAHEARSIGAAAEADEFARSLEVAHLLFLRCAAHQGGLKRVAARAAVSLLRHLRAVPVDQAFFEAGIKCREAGLKNMAFVLCNRFVDIADLVR